MVRHAIHQPSPKRTLAMQLDDEGVLPLDGEFLAALGEGDALGVPGPLPTCESCWAEEAVAIVLCPGEVARFRGAACVTDHRQADVRLVPILSC
jgi:hypothetical protein